MSTQSPFPGMDPYLERYWGDVHTMLIGYLRDALQPQLPPDLVARVEERVSIDGGGDIRETRRPDTVVVEHPNAWAARSSAPTGAATIEPIILHAETDPLVHRSIQILDLEGRHVVTAIELLSPYNKLAGSARQGYLNKRDEIFASDTNLVEIDLVRAGDWVQMVRPYHVLPQHRTPYRVTIRRHFPREQFELYPITLRHPLPAIPIPLREADSDGTVDLQALLDRVYQMGRYDRTDYRTECMPLFENGDAEWVEALLRDAGKR